LCGEKGGFVGAVRVSKEYYDKTIGTYVLEKL